MNDVYAWIAGNTAAVLAFGTWLLRLQKQTNDAERDARDAKEEALVFKAALADLHNTITSLTASFALFRETTARDVVSHAVLKELEDRLGNLTRVKYEQLVRQNDDLRASIESLNTRFDNFIASLVTNLPAAPVATPRRRRT